MFKDLFKREHPR